jgi:non-ribosomal peptide synthetase component F
VSARFEEQVRRYPDRTAVRTPNVTLTYSALNQQANRIARAIVNQCGTEQTQVAHFVTDDARSIAAILGILKAGKIYLTLDPRHPHARNLQVLNTADATLVITDNHNLEAARELAGAGELLNVDAIPSNVGDTNLGLAIPPDALACIFFTSGSTGQPKGVLHSQRNLLAWALSYGRSNSLSPADRICVISAGTSAQSMANIFSALLSGAAACPFRVGEHGPGPLASWLTDEEITIYHSSPSVFRSLVQSTIGKRRIPSPARASARGRNSLCRLISRCTRNTFLPTVFSSVRSALPKPGLFGNFSPITTQPLVAAWFLPDTPPGERTF